MSVEIPAIPQQTTTESNDLFLMHNVGTNRTKGITYQSLKNELTLDIDHVTASQLDDAKAFCNAYTDVMVDNITYEQLSAATFVSSFPLVDYIPIVSTEDNIVKKMLYPTFRSQLKSEIMEVSTANLNSTANQLRTEFAQADLNTLNSSVPTLATVSVATPDSVIISDASDSGKPKKVTLTDLSSSVKTIQDLVNNTTLNSAIATLSALIDSKQRETLELVFPIGSKFINNGNVNPASLLGFGIWARERGVFYAAVDEGDTDFSAGGSLRGNKTHTHGGGTTAFHALTTNEMPSHTHGYRDTYYAERGSSASIYEYIDGYNNNTGSHSTDHDNNEYLYFDKNTYPTGAGQPHSHNIDIEKHLPPYLTEYVWRRVA